MKRCHKQQQNCISNCNLDNFVKIIQLLMVLYSYFEKLACIDSETKRIGFICNICSQHKIRNVSHSR